MESALERSLSDCLAVRADLMMPRVTGVVVGGFGICVGAVGAGGVGRYLVSVLVANA